MNTVLLKMKLLILAVFCIGVDANNHRDYGNAAIRPGFRFTCGLSPVEKAIGPIERNGRRSSENRARKFVQYNGNGLVNNEVYVRNKDNYVYPCNKKDYDCIRQFFGENCDCQPTYGPVADPFCVEQHTAFFASINVSATYKDVEFGGLSKATIYTSFYNKKTGWVVLSIKVPVLTVKTPNMCFEYHRPGQESIIRCDCATVIYKSLTITAEFPGLPHCRLDLADIHADTDDLYPEFVIGPNVYDSTDPTVKGAYESLKKNIPIIVKENLLFKAQLIMAKYIQSIICDFKLKICSV